MCDPARRQAVHLCLWASRGVCMSLYRPTHAPGGRRAAVYPGPFGVPTVKAGATQPRQGNHEYGELSSGSARCDRQTALRVARRVDFRARCGGLSPRMMPPPSTTDTARTPPAAGHVTTGVRCTRPHVPTSDLMIGVVRRHPRTPCPSVPFGCFVPPDESGDVWADRWR